MNQQKLEETVQYIVKQGFATIQTKTDEQNAKADFLNIFTKNDDEFNDSKTILEKLGKEIETSTSGTGITFLLNSQIQTVAGPLKLIRLRTLDQTRPQRGAIDFKISDYQKLKDSCFSKNSGDYALVIRTGFELIEIKGIDVLVYVPNISMGQTMGLY